MEDGEEGEGKGRSNGGRREKGGHRELDKDDRRTKECFRQHAQ